MNSPLILTEREDSPDAEREPGVDESSPHTHRRPLLQSDIRELRPHNDSSSSEAVSLLPEGAAARRLVDALVARGVDTFFGIPGGPVCPLFEAIRREPRARLIESRHESNAAFAAALYYRASGRVPAVIVTAGPGITNAVTGVASASLERIPMLVISGDVAWASTGGRMAQDSGPEGIDMEAMLAPITRAQIRASSPRSVVGQGLAALDAACDPRFPGPALFVVALDRSMSACETITVTPPPPSVVPAPIRDHVVATAFALAEARRPLIVIGAGCRGYERNLRDLVDAFNLPFVTTPRAKGLVSEKHPRSLRNGGMAASLWARRYTAEPVDACLVLGTDLDDTSMGPTRYLGPGGRLFHVDTDARVFGRNLPTDLAVTADVGAFARSLYDEVTRNGLVNAHARLALAEARALSPFDVAHPDDDDAMPVRPHRLVRDLQAAAGRGARFVTDIGEHMLFALHYLTAATPDSFFVQLNLGSMGSGIAGAIGLSLADPCRRVVCIAGDGGMQMAGAEVLVAVKERLPILFAVFNDGRYNMVHHGMKQIFGAAAPYDSPPIDFSVWAAAFGLPARVVTRPGEVTTSMVDSMLAHGPALLDLRADSDVRVRGGGRVEALQHMSMLNAKPETR